MIVGIQFRNPKFYLMVASDLLLVSLALYLAFSLRFDFDIPAYYLGQFKRSLPVLVPLQVAMLFPFGLYRGMWRFTSLHDMIRLSQAVVLANLVFVAGLVLANRFVGFSRGILILDTLLFFFLCGGLRLGIRLMFAQGRKQRAGLFRRGAQGRTRTRLLVIGAGYAGEKIIREIDDNQGLALHVVGVLDDDRSKAGKLIHGVPVLGAVERLHEVIEKYQVTDVIIAIANATGEQMREIVEHCEDSKVSFRTVPGIGELIDGKVSVESLREVNFADLLGREAVHIDSEQITDYLRGKVVMVSGCGGSIGSELCRQILPYKPGLLLLVDSSEANLFEIEAQLKHQHGFQDYVPVLCKIQNAETMDRIFARYQPEVVFHAAAYKHVPMLEVNPWEAVHNNIAGSRVLMELAVKHKVRRFVLVSTDKAVRPVNVMGASKRVAEMVMKGFTDPCTKFIAVRFGNVVGSSGSVVPLFREQIRRGGPVTVTDPEVTRYFMTIPEAAQLILQAGSMGEGGEIYILEMGRPVKIADMARDLIRLSGKEPDVDIRIEFSGLRPGEKLYEELITEGEGIHPTRHEKIYALRDEAEPGSNGLLEAVDTLRELAHSHDAGAIRDQLKRIVPEYVPGDSPSVLE